MGNSDVGAQLGDLLVEFRSLGRKLDELSASNADRLLEVERRIAEQEKNAATLAVQQGAQQAAANAQQASTAESINEIKQTLEDLRTEVAELNRLKNHGKGVIAALCGLMTLVFILFSKVDLHMPRISFGG